MSLAQEKHLEILWIHSMGKVETEHHPSAVKFMTSRQRVPYSCSGHLNPNWYFLVMDDATKGIDAVGTVL